MDAGAGFGLKLRREAGGRMVPGCGSPSASTRSEHSWLADWQGPASPSVSLLNGMAAGGLSHSGFPFGGKPVIRSPRIARGKPPPARPAPPMPQHAGVLGEEAVAIPGQAVGAGDHRSVFISHSEYFGVKKAQAQGKGRGL